MNRTEMTLLQRAELELLWLWAWLFAVMPYWFKYYVVENLLYFLLCYVLRYRRKVVRRNLRNSFPEKSERELAEICRRFYRTLAELFVDTINMAHMSADKARTVLTVKGLEEHRAAVKGRDWIALTAHYGCWEYCSYWGLYEPSQMLVAVYHPFRSVVMGGFYQRVCHHEESTTGGMTGWLGFYRSNRETGD